MSDTRNAADGLKHYDTHDRSRVGRLVHDGWTARIESVELDEQSSLGASPFQLFLPFDGLMLLFARSTAHTRLVDATRVLFARQDEHLALARASGSTLRALSIRPTPAALDLLRAGGFHADWPVAGGTCVKDSRIQLLTHCLVRARADAKDLDRLVLDLLRRAHAAIASPPAPPTPLVERALLLIHERRLQRTSLPEIARALNTTPKYLTNTFKRQLGVPFCNYDLRLRLNRALLELPMCRDITQLALALGFSSHSHFSSMFNAAFGLTPGLYRSSQRVFDRAAQSRQCSTPDSTPDRKIALKGHVL